MATIVSEATKERLFARLGVSSFAEVLDRDYSELSRDHDVDRETHTKLYANQSRGSVRLASGRFYTIKEHEERVARVKNQKLP